MNPTVDTVPFDLSINTFHSFDVTTAVNDFLKNPAGNFGFLIRINTHTDSTSNRFNFYNASECPTVHLRPKLTLFLESTALSRTGGNNQTNDRAIRILRNSIQWYPPFQGVQQITISNLQGRKVLEHSVTGADAWHSIPSALSDGIYTITFIGPHCSITKKFTFLHQ